MEVLGTPTDEFILRISSESVSVMILFGCGLFFCGYCFWLNVCLAFSLIAFSTFVRISTLTQKLFKFLSKTKRYRPPNKNFNIVWFTRRKPNEQNYNRGGRQTFMLLFALHFC